MKKKGQRLATIPGLVPTLKMMPSGCRFADRCEFKQDRCVNQQPEIEEQDGRIVRCHFPVGQTEASTS